MKPKEKDINVIRDCFSNEPVLKAYLFGSYSRDQADGDSDVDILVDPDYSHHIGLAFVQFDLEQKLQRPVDLVSSGAITRRLLPYITRDKKLICESPNLKSTLDA